LRKRQTAKEELVMGRVIVTEHVTLDGVMQAPARTEEDIRGGFDRGGWAVPRADDEVTALVMGEAMMRRNAMVLGRRTYEDLEQVWSTQPSNPFTDVLNKTQKYVASRSLKGPLSWQNSALLSGDAADAVGRLKSSVDGDLTILGSGDLVASLGRRNLIDGYVLIIHPIVLGQGRRLFRDRGPSAEFSLSRCVPTATGIVIAEYTLSHP
jgi:dihydrofolate reductase